MGSVKKAAKKRLLDIINACTIRKSEAYPNSIFYMDKEKVVLEQDNKNKIFYGSNNLFRIFADEFHVTPRGIADFFNETLEKHLEITEFETRENCHQRSWRLGNHKKVYQDTLQI